MRKESMWGSLPLGRDSLCKLAGPQFLGPMSSSLNITKGWDLTAAGAQSLSHVWPDPMDCSPPGFSVHGVFQARTLEWVSISSSRGSSWPRDWTRVSCIAGGFFACWAIREAHLTNKTQSCSPRTLDGSKFKKKIHMQCKGIPLLLY